MINLKDEKYQGCSARVMIEEGAKERSITLLPKFKIPEKLVKEYEKILNITINQNILNFFAVWQGWGTNSYHIIPVKIGQDIIKQIDTTLECVLKLESLLQKHNKYNTMWTEFVSKDTIHDIDKDSAVEYGNKFYLMIKQDYMKLFTLCALNVIYNKYNYDIVLGSIADKIIQLCDEYNKIEAEKREAYYNTLKTPQEEKRQTILISGFPGVGKSQFMKDHKDLVILDSDSSNFSWVKDEAGNNTKERNPEFPQCYIDHIKENMGKVDVILISSHDVVRKALKDNNIKYNLVYPSVTLLDEYMNRYIKRESDYKFIKVIESNWYKWLDDIAKDESPQKIKLYKDQYINDLFKGIPVCTQYNELCSVHETNADEYPTLCHNCTYKLKLI